MISTAAQASLDALITEATGAEDVMLNELSVTELVEYMNQRDRTIAEAVGSALPTIVLAVEAIADRMARGGRLIYVGAGTSGRLGVLDASEIPPTFGTDPSVVVGVIAGGDDALVRSSESVEDDDEAGAADMAQVAITHLDSVVGITTSGRTPYVMGAIRAARDKGALTVGLCCNSDTPLSAIADHGVEVPIGPEVVTGSTRLAAGTATKMVLNMFSTIAMIRLGKTYGTLMVDMKASNAKLVRRAIRMVSSVTKVGEDTARDALESAGWQTKVAIAMIATGTAADTARELLEEAGGHLEVVLSR